MRDQILPSIKIPQEGAVHITIPSTDLPKPSILAKKELAAFNITAQKTNASVLNQGYTYNEAGFTYNQVNVDYGGIYNMQHDISPMVNSIDIHTPLIAKFADIYTTTTPPVPNTYHSVGPGFFLFITY